MPIRPSRGRSLLPVAIDKIADEEPTRPWASVPINPTDLTQGFKDVTFREFGNAINRAAHWLDSQLGKAGSDFPTFSYAGPKDIRYPVLAVAAAKVGRRILLVSPWARPQAQEYLINVTNCEHVLYAAEISGVLNKVLTAEKLTSRIVLQVSPVSSLLDEDVAVQPYPYTKTWEEGFQDPVAVFHTSGTTADPKPLVYTQLSFCSMDAYDVLRDPGTRTLTDQYRDSRLFTPFPAMHLGGMIVMLQLPLWLGAVAVIGPDSKDIVSVMNAVLELGKVNGMLLTPAYVEGLTDDPGFEERLGGLEYLQYGGAPLPKYIGDRIPAHVKMQPVYGCTEAGICKMIVRDDDEWEYCSFMSADGIEFEYWDEGQFELVYHRHWHSSASLHQQVFQIFPELNIFRTKDLFTPHPTKYGLWRYIGRADDMIKFKHGESLRANTLEGLIMQHDCIRSAVVGGKGRPNPCVILELTQEYMGLEKSAKLDLIMEAIHKANQSCSELVRLQRSLVLFASSEKPLPRNQKGGIMRNAAFDLYKDEVDMLYEDDTVSS